MQTSDLESVSVAAAAIRWRSKMVWPMAVMPTAAQAVRPRNWRRVVPRISLDLISLDLISFMTISSYFWTTDSGARLASHRSVITRGLA